jgi:hypothetical protein
METVGVSKDDVIHCMVIVAYIPDQGNAPVYYYIFIKIGITNRNAVRTLSCIGLIRLPCTGELQQYSKSPSEISSSIDRVRGGVLTVTSTCSED